MDFDAILAARYGRSFAIDGVQNARRVTVRGVACVAKLIVHRSHLGVHMPGGISARAGFQMEREAYARLGARWPVTLVDSFKAAHGATSGYVIVTTDFHARPWSAYVASPTNDAAVVRQIVRQVRAVHRAGLVHWDLFPKNVLFRPPCSVAVIDFEKSEFSTSRDDQDGECAALVVHFAASDATRGVALGLLRSLEPRAARLALDRLLANEKRARVPLSEPPATKRKALLRIT